MKAVRIVEPFKVECIEAPKPTPKPGEALIKIEAAGICGSDIGAFKGVRAKFAEQIAQTGVRGPLGGAVVVHRRAGQTVIAFPQSRTPLSHVDFLCGDCRKIGFPGNKVVRGGQAPRAGGGSGGERQDGLPRPCGGLSGKRL